MKKHIVTNWENDLIDVPEQMVQDFAKKNWSGFELEILSGLRHRSFEEIYDTLEYSRAIIMQPSLLDKEQIIELAKQMSHGIWINFNSNTNNLDVRFFHFISMNPFEDAKSIIKILDGVKDSVNESAIVKIVKSISVNFHGFNGEHYEYEIKGYFPENIKIIRHK